MESQSPSPRPTDCFEFNDVNTSDVTVRLANNLGRPELFHAHSSILKERSKFFVEKLSDPNRSRAASIDVRCTDSTSYDHHVGLLRRFYLPDDSLVDSWASVDSALGVLEAAADFHCDEIVKSCIKYLEAAPWEDKEEESVLRAVSKLGPMANPVLARVRPVEFTATKTVFLSAIRFATSAGPAGPPAPLGPLRTSAQEQVEYMLSGDDDDIALVTADEEVKSEMRKGLASICSSFEEDLSFLATAAAERQVMLSVADLGWVCNVLAKMGLMKDFVDLWVDLSGRVVTAVEEVAGMWGLKVKLIEVAGKVLEAVGYGNVVVPPACRLELVKRWLPYVRDTRPRLDAAGQETEEELWEGVEGAMVALVSALPSDDQAAVLAEWMDGERERVRYPDLSEAFEVWCYRSKSARRRLVGEAGVGL